MQLYSPLNIRQIELKNRLVLSPMCMYSAKDGVMNDFHQVHYRQRAQGGAGLVMIEATGVEPRGRISPGCLGLWNKEHAIELKALAKFIHEQTESKLGIQLAHAGRKASTWDGIQIKGEGGWQTVAPSAIPYKSDEIPPEALSKNEILSLQEDFLSAADRAIEAGVDIIELHAAHGYLIHQFLSPLSNQREDEYGGSLENRMRFLLELVEKLQEKLDQNTGLFVRISADEYSEGGWNVTDSITLAKELKKGGVDLIDVSSGGNIHGARIEVKDSYQVPFAEAIKKEAEIKTGAVGLIYTIDQAEGVLRENQADLIFMGRAMLRDPYLPTRGALENGEKCFYPPQYERAMKK